MVFVILWAAALGTSAMVMKKMWPDESAPAVVEDPNALDSRNLEDEYLIRDQLNACHQRLREFLAASDIGGQSQHIINASQTLSRMVQYQQFNPILSSKPTLTSTYYKVLHTPAGRAIETMWSQDDGKQIEAVFFEEEGEWKIDWDAFVRSGSEPWGLFLAGSGSKDGQFRLLARERFGANGRDPEYIGLVLYSTRAGHPGDTESGSPEIRVKRSSRMAAQIEEAFKMRAKETGPFKTGAVAFDPDEMIRLNVKVNREGEDERFFNIREIVADHWLQAPLEVEGR